MSKKQKQFTVVSTEACTACKALCCRHIAFPIDKPTNKKEYDYIRWYLLHEKVSVFIDFDKSWMMEVKSPCVNLGAHNQCMDYDNRPAICRNYPLKNEECEFISDGATCLVKFSTAAEFEKYLDKKKINWRFKK